MNRLTKYKPSDKSMFPYRLKDEELSTELDSIHKLGQLEDIEEELGIGLITFYKALTKGVWVKNEVGQIYHTNIYLDNLLLLPDSTTKNNLCFVTPNNELLLFDRIKQDWALTREELDNGRYKKSKGMVWR